jgi:hypothetical protein
MKKKLALVLALVFLGLSLFGCAPKGPTAEDLAAVQTALDAKTKELEDAQKTLGDTQKELESAKVFDPSGIIDWYNESDLWRTVKTGAWSTDPADQITDEELARAFSMAAKQQTAVQFASNFYVVIKDPEEQRAALVAADAANRDVFVGEGTVTILMFEDQMITEEEGHVNPYRANAMGEGNVPFYMYTPWPYQASGFVTGMFGFAAATMGYYTHYYAGVNGPQAITDIADKYKSMSYFVKDDYKRAMGVVYSYGEEAPAEALYPVKGNCVCVGAVVVGKPPVGEALETWATNYGRPENWVIFDNE